MGKAKNVTVGFKYLMSLQMGMCRGPVDALLEIRVGDRQAWSGEMTGNTKFNINKGDLFGGTKAEGGIEGQAEFYMGGASQTVSDKVKSILPGLSPEFRGIVTLFFDGMVCAMNPYPKPWAFKLRRLLQGWDGGAWYPGKIRIDQTTTYTDDEGRSKTGTIQSMNGVHILYEACTNRVWGRGIPRSAMYEAQWQYAADLAYDEGMGLCLAWKRTDNLDSFAQNILDHLGATMFVDKQTGLLTLKLIRDDYVFEQLPVFTNDSGLIAVEECSVAAGTSLINEIVVGYHSPLSNEDGKVRSQNLAGIQTAGSIVSSNVDYMGAPTAELAQRLADRDLNAQALPLRGFKIKVDHRGWKIQPGTVFRIQDPKRGGIDIAIRAGAVEEMPMTDGYLHISAVEDVFAMPVNGTAAVQPPVTNPPDRLPSIARRRAYEVPYALLNRMYPPGEFNAIQPQWGYYGMAAEKPTGLSMGYDLAMRAGGESSFEIRGQGGFVPLGELMANISYLTTEVKLNKLKDADEMVEGECIYLGEEIMRVDAIQRMNDTEYWLTVARGVYDTVPAPQAAGQLAWFFEDEVGSDSVAYVGGETVDGKVLPYTLAGRFPEDQAPIDTVKMNFRFYRPYAPGYVWLNDQWRWYVKTSLSKNAPVLTISWKHRDRVAQEDTRVDHEVGNIGPEPGTTYALRFYNDQNVLVRQETGISGTSYQYLWTQAMSDLGVTEQDDGRVFDMYATLHSRRNGYESWQGYRIQIQVEDIATYLMMAQMAQQTSMTVSDADGGEDDSTPTQGLMMASFAQQTGTDVDDSDGSNLPSDGLAMASLGQAASQMTLMPVVMDATLFEAPYLELYRLNLSLNNSRPMGVVARTSDRLTDGYEFWSSALDVTYDPKGFPIYTPKNWQSSGSGAFTPWAVTTTTLDYLDTQVSFGATSEQDGVPLEGISVGDLALIDKEIVRIDSIGNGFLVLGRGVADTVPAIHYKNTPIWFFQKKNAISGYVYGGQEWVGVKLKPETHTVPYPLDQVPQTNIQMNVRPVRPYAPGDVFIDNHRWWTPAVAFTLDAQGIYHSRDVSLSWKHRDRLSQAGNAVDHMAGNIGPEPGTKYRVWVGYVLPNSKGGATKVTLRQYDVDGTGFTYTAAMADADGAKAGPVFKACGNVTIMMTLFAVNPSGLESWQGYSFYLRVPTNACPPGSQPGGGNQPGGGSGGGSGGGNPGDPGGPNEPDPTDPTTPDPTDPVDPNWPPEEPPVIVDPPEPPDPDFEGSWSYDWDHGWANTLPKTL